MTTTSIKIGDVVQLKSGGPRMTVIHVTEKSMVGCTWFVSGEVKKGAFPVEALEQPVRSTTSLIPL